MTNVFCVLAQLSGLNLNPNGPVAKNTGLVFMNLLAILATGLVLGGLSLFWVRFYLRKKNRHHHHHHHHHHDLGHESDGAANADLTASTGVDTPRPGPRPHRRRRRRRDHRPRNPTLGETGGLPPSKIEPNPNPRL